MGAGSKVFLFISTKVSINNQEKLGRRQVSK
jgi:hypothetical protein